VGEVAEDWPETAARVKAILEGLRGAGLLLHDPPRTFDPVEAATTDAELAQILAVHDPAYVRFLQTAYEDAARLRHGEDRRPVVPEYFPHVRPRRQGDFVPRAPRNVLHAAGFYAGSVEDVIGERSFACAVAAAKCAVAATEAVVCGGLRAAYSLARPPGHHAGPASYGGYCFLNNAAIAARHALMRLGAGARVSVLDVDYHHGDGTQAVLWNDPAVQFVSVHADPHEDYPYFSGFADETGGDAARGTKLNIPLPLGTPQDVWLAAFGRAVQAVREFAPRLLVVSLGFDSAEGDPETQGCAHNAENEFHELGAMIRGLCLPTVFVQEGGYSHGARLGALATSFFKGFLAL